MSKIWKVAVIGTGDMGKQHIKGWQLAGHEVVSVTDIDLQRARELATQFNVKQVYQDYKEAIVDRDVEIVSVCLPLALHAPVTIFAAEQGKHIFCEKPLARNFREVADMEEAVRKAGVQFGLGLQRNLSVGVQTARQYVQEGRLGRPVIFHNDSLAQIRPKRVMHDADGNGGPLMDLGCHYYIMWQTVFASRPKTVYARGQLLAKDREELAHIAKLAYDTAQVTIEYETGDVGIFTVSWGLPPGVKLKAHVDRLYGPKGGLEGGFNNNAAKLTFYDGDQVSELHLESYASLHNEQFRLFVDALNEGKPAPVGFEAGKDVLALTLAIFRSIETGEVIDFGSTIE
ncbi:Gfo/Idh/MocA family oxidoreductase [Paenibacillus hemerocallicola]|jgi:predicted dehydrogenase|uniref:Gfo/Idh/MocA family oxidoreductase n=1 Tax=Paenibacillus hemerocallicola TaxID=1172614 RepID=A0A5C4TDS0_9BACL|nr:Gfo/Idh/MocA family oxidoreductase [Paenibacillus hemerocallicola]TNJ66992.1 Gfo/Idh/MocA family oxidoreductase [Paenibacillus hemerocallicola]